jgi:hypothetical protein
MQQHVKSFYDKFFEFHPEFAAFKIWLDWHRLN